MTEDSRTSRLAAANADLARSLYDAFNRADIEYAINASSPDITVEFVAWEQNASGRAAVRAYLTNWKTMAPDGVVEVLAQLSSDEGVVSECVYRGVNTGALATPDGDIAPTGRAFAVRFCEIVRITDGKLVSVTNYADAGSLLVQLGLMPERSSTST